MSLMCRALGVSTSGYYDWQGREPSKRAQDDVQLASVVRAVHEESRRTYGSPRVHRELRERGICVGRKRVERVMRENDLMGRRRPRFRRTTDSKHDGPIAPNLLERNFTTDQPDRVWVGDITYIWTNAGWLYLATIIDLFSRRVVGWSMASQMRTELVLGALQAALGKRTPSPSGLIFHSDRGSQYASAAFREALEAAGIRSSMSRKGDCWDNAVAESFFSTLKTELVHRLTFLNRQAARFAIAEWVEVFYNGKRRHSAIDYATPREAEEQFHRQTQLSRAA